MILRDSFVVGALILIFLHPDLPKIFGHILKISMFSFYNLQHSGTLFWFFFKHENSELQFRKRTKEKMVRFFCVYVKLTKLKKLSTLWTLFLPLYDKSCKIWIKKEIKISFSFYKNGPLWSARSGRGNRWEHILAAKANAKELIRGRG